MKGTCAGAYLVLDTCLVDIEDVFLPVVPSLLTNRFHVLCDTLGVDAASLIVKNFAVQSVAIHEVFIHVSPALSAERFSLRSAENVDASWTVALAERPNDWMTARVPGILPSLAFSNRSSTDASPCKSRKYSSQKGVQYQILYPVHITVATEGAPVSVCFVSTLLVQYCTADRTKNQNHDISTVLCCVEIYQ